MIRCCFTPPPADRLVPWWPLARELRAEASMLASAIPYARLTATRDQMAHEISEIDGLLRAALRSWA